MYKMYTHKCSFLFLLHADHDTKTTYLQYKTVFRFDAMLVCIWNERVVQINSHPDMCTVNPEFFASFNFFAGFNNSLVAQTTKTIRE